MSLTRIQFDILVSLVNAESSLTQRKLEYLTGYSIGIVNQTIKDLSELGFVKKGKITSEGINALEPYQVKRAIIMAAGFGSRMVPVTLTTPKPLVEVNGKRIIDTLIDALVGKGIEDIIIVRGYLKHKFNELLVKYPFLKFVDNDLYNEANNIYSIYLVRDKLENAYILEGDLVLYNLDIIDKYHYCSDFLAFPVEKSDDWCFTCENKRINSFSRGRINCFQEVGISYWDRQDGKKLRKDIREVFESPGGKELLWENVPLVNKKDNYIVRIKECKKEDIIEIDSFNELCALDPLYKNFRKPDVNIEKSIIRNICNTLNCKKEDIHDIEFMKIGLTNVSFKFTVDGEDYVYRKPGSNTIKFINRKSEVFSEEIAYKLGLNKTVISINDSGWKLSKYVKNSVHINPYNAEDQKASMKLIKKLHDAKIVSEYDFDYVKEAERFIKMFSESGDVDFRPYEGIHNKIVEIDKKLTEKGYEKVLCHNDFWFWNILKDNRGKLILIDWEYSGNSYPASDVAYFVSSLTYGNKEYLELAGLYENHNLNVEEKTYYISVLAIVMWYWFVWSLYKETNGETIEDKQLWYDKAINALNYLDEQQ